MCSTSRKYAKFTNSYHFSCLYKGRTGTTLELVASCDDNIVVYANMRAGDLYRTARTDHVAYPVGPKQFGRCRAAAGSWIMQRTPTSPAGPRNATRHAPRRSPTFDYAISVPWRHVCPTWHSFDHTDCKDDRWLNLSRSLRVTEVAERVIRVYGLRTGINERVFLSPAHCVVNALCLHVVRSSVRPSVLIFLWTQ